MKDATIEEQILSAKKIEELLEKKQEEIQRELNEKEAQKKELEKALVRNEKLVKNIFTVDEVLATIKEMRRIQNGYGKDVQYLSHNKTRARWREEKESIIQIQEELEKIGICSKGINEIVYANFNRPDRDDYFRITREDLLDLAEIEEE